MSHDVIVLGAGMVGVSTALHLQESGLSVALVDRRAIGEEASHGNAGIIEKDGMIPLTIPSNVVDIARFASNRTIHMHYHPTFMPRLASWLWKMWRISNPAGIDVYARAVQPLRQRAADEHGLFAKEAGLTASFAIRAGSTFITGPRPLRARKRRAAMPMNLASNMKCTVRRAWKSSNLILPLMRRTGQFTGRGAFRSAHP